jgi:hypothetical protein
VSDSGREEGGIDRRLDSGESHILGGRRVEVLAMVGGRVAVMVIDEKRKGGGGWNARIVSSPPKQVVVGGGVSVKYEGKHVQVLQARGYVDVCGRWW